MELQTQLTKVATALKMLPLQLEFLITGEPLPSPGPRSLRMNGAEEALAPEEREKKNLMKKLRESNCAGDLSLP